MLVLEQAGYTLDFKQLDPGVLYSGLSDGSVDFTSSAWLPLTQASYWNTYNSSVDWVRANLVGAKVGLVVPTYMTKASFWSGTSMTTGLTKMSQLLNPDVISALDSNGDGKAEITGIDSGAGMMITLNNFIKDNSSWTNTWTVTASSGAGMTASLDTAYNAQDPIVVTLWSPHWAFSKYNLTYLQDDIGLYGGADNVVTLARQNLNSTTEGGHLYNILSRFHWTQDDCNSVMLSIQDGSTPAKAAQDWMNANNATVNDWIGNDMVNSSANSPGFEAPIMVTCLLGLVSIKTLRKRK